LRLSYDEVKHSTDKGKHSTDEGKHSTDEGKHFTDEDKHSTDEGKHSILTKENTVLTKVNTVLIKVNYKGNIATRKQKLTSQAASRKQTPNRNIRNTAENFARAIAASCVQSSQFFEHMLPEQFFELKNEDAINNYKNFRETCPG
jgi:hypothetical protein